MTPTHRASGTLFGMAFGDALGAQTEFLSVERILQQFPPAGPLAPEGSPALVTDDTQMALAVAEALVEAPRPLTAAYLEPALRRRFVEWYISPDNTRAPGNTCLAACALLERGAPWLQATVTTSKGCGANMRVAPVGLVPANELGMNNTTRGALAQFQAALTHGHPTALAAADLTAMTISYLASGYPISDLPRWLHRYGESQRDIYHEDWLGPLWERPAARQRRSTSRVAGMSA
jgi:ADP-ribosylglycohydrolase